MQWLLLRTSTAGVGRKPPSNGRYSPLCLCCRMMKYDARSTSIKRVFEVATSTKYSVRRTKYPGLRTRCPVLCTRYECFVDARSAAYSNQVLGAECVASMGATVPCVRLNWRRLLPALGTAWTSAERTAPTTTLDPRRTVAPYQSGRTATAGNNNDECSAMASRG